MREPGAEPADLTASNPTDCGLIVDKVSLLTPLADVRALVYHPEPFGLQSAREAVCAYYLDHGALVRPDQVCLTTSTSEAYSFLFRLLCNPGDEILIAQPSYPLFDLLADLSDVNLVSYALVYDHSWQTVTALLRTAVTSRTRAIAVVHPNNPTGHFVSAQDRMDLLNLCSEFDLALIVDEVFLDYSLTPQRSAEQKSFSSHAVEDRSSQPLTFVLSGLSKVAALPQMKAAWIVTLGPEKHVEEALARLELIADSFLSVSTPVQHALPTWLGTRQAMQEQITRRTRDNLSVLDRALIAAPAVTRLAVEAGWYAILRVPALGDDEALVEELARRGVLVHPGRLFGFANDGWLIVSLLPRPDEFARGVERILAGSAARMLG